MGRGPLVIAFDGIPAARRAIRDAAALLGRRPAVDLAAEVPPERVPPAEALVHARAVLATLCEAVGDEEFFDVMSDLPADYKRTLVPAGGRCG